MIHPFGKHTRQLRQQIWIHDQALLQVPDVEVTVCIVRRYPHLGALQCLKQQPMQDAAAKAARAQQ
eukprot:9734591-Alexandrium_andersonii.AAC.1